MVALNTNTEVRPTPDLPQENQGDEPENKTSNLAKRERADLGLAILCAMVRPGVTLSRPEIAAWMDCTMQAVDKIEKRAMKKIANRLLFRERALLAEAGMGPVVGANRGYRDAYARVYMKRPSDGAMTTQRTGESRRRATA